MVEESVTRDENDDIAREEGLTEPLLSQVNASDSPTAWFSNPGSVKGSVFNLAAATLGAGALSLPYAFSRSGVGMGLLLLLVGVVLTIWTIHMLIEAGEITGIYSYEKLVCCDIFAIAMLTPPPKSVCPITQLLSLHIASGRGPVLLWR